MEEGRGKGRVLMGKKWEVSGMVILGWRIGRNSVEMTKEREMRKMEMGKPGMNGVIREYTRKKGRSEKGR